MPGLEDFDRYVEEHGIPEEHYPAAFALWYAEATGEPVPRFEKVEKAKEHPQIEGDDLEPPGRRAERPGPDLRPRQGRLDGRSGRYSKGFPSGWASSGPTWRDVASGLVLQAI